MEQYTLIGHPLGHSMSPFIHERLFAMAGRKAEYTLTDIAPEHLLEKEPFLRSLQGFNITIPHKMAVIPMVDRLDESARRYDSVNCVANVDGKLVGYNTDIDGFLYMACRAGISLSGKKVVILGSGGASLTAQTAVRQGGAAERCRPDHRHHPAGSEAGGDLHSGGKTAHAGCQSAVCRDRRDSREV